MLLFSALNYLKLINGFWCVCFFLRILFGFVLSQEILNLKSHPCDFCIHCG